MTDHKKQGYHQKEPRLTYGYLIVFLAFVIMFFLWGAYSVYGVFFNPLIEEFDWDRSVTSGAFSLSMILSGVLGTITGVLTDRFGPRLVMTVSCLLLGLGHLLMSQVNSLWQLYLFYGVIIGIGMAGSWVPLLSIVARWFLKRRSLMTGIVLSGLSIGRLVSAPIMSQIILIHEWRISYIILGSTILFFTILSSQFLKGDPDQTEFQAFGKENKENQVQQPSSEGVSFKSAVYSWQFWLAMCMFCCFGFISFSIWVHIVPHAVELKISTISAASIISIMSALSILGNFGLGGIGGDKLGNRKIIVFGFVLMMAALVLLVFYKDLWILYIAAGIFGLSFGSMAASEPPLVARLFGLRSHGLLLGFIGLGFTVGGSLGPFVAGYLFDVSGTYRMTFIICIIIGLIGLILSISLRPLKSYNVQL